MPWMVLGYDTCHGGVEAYKQLWFGGSSVTKDYWEEEAEVTC